MIITRVGFRLVRVIHPVGPAPTPVPDETFATPQDRRLIDAIILANIHERALAEAAHRQAWSQPSASDTESWSYS